MAAFYDDREDEVLAIDDIVTSMRRVIDQPPAAARKRLGCSPAAAGRDAVSGSYAAAALLGALAKLL